MVTRVWKVYGMEGHRQRESFCESYNLAKITGKAIQDDETFKSEGGFVPERDQFYFEMKLGDDLFLVGFKDLLICLKLLENIGEIPPINYKWWLQMATLYGNDILTIEQS